MDATRGKKRIPSIPDTAAIQGIQWRYRRYEGSIDDTWDTEDPLAIRAIQRIPRSRDPLFPPWGATTSYYEIIQFLLSYRTVYLYLNILTFQCRVKINEKVSVYSFIESIVTSICFV